MRLRMYGTLLTLVFGVVASKAQVVSAQLPFLYAAKGWQLSRADDATQNSLLQARTFGLLDLAVTVKNRVTVDLSYQLEEWHLSYLSIPAYLERSGHPIEDQEIVLGSLRNGSTHSWFKGSSGWRSGQLKFGVSKNWWFQNWSLDLGARYVIYLVGAYHGRSIAIVSGEKLYRVDRWISFNTSALQFSVRPTWRFSNRINLTAKLNWLVHTNAKHGIRLERISGLDVAPETYKQITTGTDHRLFAGLGLYYTNIPNKERTGTKQPFLHRLRKVIFKY